MAGAGARADARHRAPHRARRRPASSGSTRTARSSPPGSTPWPARAARSSRPSPSPTRTCGRAATSPPSRVADMDQGHVLSSHAVPVVPPVLRPGVPRGQGQGRGAGLRAGVERLHPRGVRRRPPGPVHPDDDHPAVGPGGRGRRDRADRRPRRPVDRLLREPDQARPAVDPHRLLGAGVRGGGRRRLRAVDARRLVVEPHPHVRRHAHARLHGLLGRRQPGRHAARLAVQRQLRAPSPASRSPSPRARSAGSPTSWSGPSRWSTSSASGRRASTST